MCMLSLLFTVYKECLCNAYCMWCIAAESSSIERRSKQPNINYDAARSFQSRFNNICWYLFLNCFSSFNDYSMPILRTSNFTSFLEASKHIFPKQWAFLPSHRNINRERDGNKLGDFKERQVFISLLILQCMSNFRCLPHWCLILSMAMYGWGTHNTVGHTTSFIGTTVSWTYRDQVYTLLTSSIVPTVIWLLSKEICGLMVLDNYQRGTQLREQRGGRLSKFLIRTSEAAHHVNPYLNFTWDHVQVKLTYHKIKLFRHQREWNCTRRSHSCLSHLAQSYLPTIDWYLSPTSHA